VFDADTELQLLRVVARVRLGDEHRSRLHRILEQGVDWDRLWRSAIRHKMLPLLAVHLREHPEGVPPEVLEALGRYSLTNASRMLRIARETAELVAGFGREGILAVPYKGPILGAQLYGSAGLRQSGDLDLLVSSRDVPRARRLLASRGYRPRHRLSPGGDVFMMRSRYSEAYQHSAGAPLELHWAFTNRDIALSLSLEDLVPALQPVSVGGAELPGLGREDLLLVLCVHGAKHRWDRLEWLCGLAEAIRRTDSFDWDRLVGRATRLGVRRMLLLGLVLAHDLLEAPVPEHVVRIARQDPAVSHSAALVPGFLSDEAICAEAGSLPTDLFRYRLRERRRDRLRFIVYRFTTPSQPERWSAVTVGPWVVPTHWVTRPLGLPRRLVPATRSYLASLRGRS
jgi:hypothetical protein